MTKPCCKRKSGPSDGSAARPPVSPPAALPRSEPVMRRWPHPAGPPVPPEEDVRKLLRRQTELLLEVRALLVNLTSEQNLRE